MNIEVYSIKSFTGSALKMKLESALAELNLPYKVKELNSVDDFIRAGLSSVPAVKIGNRVIEHHDPIPFDTTVKLAMDHIMSDHEKSILVPVDFSAESINALRYARMLATHLHLGITVVHVHQPLIDPVTGSAFDVEMIKNNRERLEEMVVGIGWDQYRVGEHVPIHTHFETGDVTSNLLNLAADEKYDLVLMSTKAENTFVKRMLGSVSSTVSRFGQKPVIVVPPNSPIRFPGKIVVGMTEDLLKGNSLDYVLSFAASNLVFVDFIHVTNNHDEFKKLKNNLYERIVCHKEELTGFNIRSTPFVEGKVHEALLDYGMKARAGLLVLVTRHRSFFESLTHRSVSKKALLNPSLPLMILHSA